MQRHGSSLKHALAGYCGNMTLRWLLRMMIYIVIPLIVVTTLLCMWLGGSAFIGPGVRKSHRQKCSDDASKEYLDKLCKNYTDGLVTGGLCEALCVQKEIHFQRCLDRGRKLHVLQAEWRGIPIIFKTPKNLGHKLGLRIIPGEVVTRKEFLQQANRSIFQSVANLKHHPTTEKLLKEVYSSCDANADGKLNYDEAILCWQLLKTQEYVVFSLLENVADVPDLYGSCGLLYGIEFVDPKPLLGLQTIEFDTRSWRVRANLALALLVMIETVEETPYGTFHMCDVDERSVGVVKKDGRLVTKIINVDRSWFDSDDGLKQIEEDKPCVGPECTMVRCMQEQVEMRACCLVTCDTPRCNTKHYFGSTNNLQSLCYMMFHQYASWHPALLFDPPKSIESELERVLDQCINPGKRLMHNPKDVMATLRRILQLSI